MPIVTITLQWMLFQHFCHHHVSVDVITTLLSQSPCCVSPYYRCHCHLCMFQLHGSIETTLAYLEQNLPSVHDDPYLMSLVTYALHVSESSMKDDAYQRLQDLSTSSGDDCTAAIVHMSKFSTMKVHFITSDSFPQWQHCSDRPSQLGPVYKANFLHICITEELHGCDSVVCTLGYSVWVTYDNQGCNTGFIVKKRLT